MISKRGILLVPLLILGSRCHGNTSRVSVPTSHREDERTGVSIPDISSQHREKDWFSGQGGEGACEWMIFNIRMENITVIIIVWIRIVNNRIYF